MNHTNDTREKILALTSVATVKMNTENKKGVALSASEWELLRKDKGIVERIYVSRGWNGYNADNIKCDKFAGLLINGSIYWVYATFARLSELSVILHPLGISMSSDGCWGWGDDREKWFDSKVTKVKTAQNMMLEEGSRWFDKAVWANKESDRLMWTVAELQQLLLDSEKADKKAA